MILSDLPDTVLIGGAAAVVALLALLLVTLLRARRQRITLDDAGPAGPTLQRVRRERPLSPSLDAVPSSDLVQIKGLGPRAAQRLNAAGIASIAELAALDEPAAAAIDASLGDLAGRLARDQWVEQARLLEAGDQAAFEARFGKLGDRA